MRDDALTLDGGSTKAAETSCETTSAKRLRALVDGQYDFIWRSLRRLGVAAGDVDDAVQQVFLTMARKLAAIEPGKERSFLFQTALRVAADNRRTHRRRREVGENELARRDEIPDPGPAADDMLELVRARQRLDEILSEMPIDLRAVFVLFELDEVTMAEIAVLLDLPLGTVASRIRRARAHFREAAARGREVKDPRGDGT